MNHKETPLAKTYKEASEVPITIRGNPQLTRCYNNLHDHDLAELIIIAGRTGFGKSDTALYCMTAMDVGQTNKTITGWKGRFELNRCHWVAKDFIEDMTKQDEKKKGFYPKGSCFLFDEVNVEASNLEFQSIKGKAAVTALQTNRKYNYAVFMTTPSYKSCSVGLRRLATAIIEMKKKVIINGKPFARALFKWVDYDNISGDDYKKYHRSAVAVIIDYRENGEPVTVWRRKRYKTILIPLISEQQEIEYNVLKDEAMERNRETMLEQFEYYKKYLGETGMKVQKHKFEDLKKVFLNEDTSINWSLIVVDGKPYEHLVENKLAEFDDTLKGIDVTKVWKWLRLQWKMEGNLPEYKKIKKSP